ncbi:MAG: hypothetical protein IJU56_02295 [Clostridia bacterium]|nr:hypothetical protein [Clostridia bacterium]
MKVAIIGSRSLHMEIPPELVPKNTTQIISGAANGIDRSARAFALEHRIQILEILPDYARYGRSAPLQRNDMIIALADLVLVFWDGKSRGTKYVIDRCHAVGKPVVVKRY